MWAALLSFLGSLFTALPKTLEIIRDWQREKAILQSKQAKDQRNEAAIQRARSGGDTQ